MKVDAKPSLESQALAEDRRKSARRDDDAHASSINDGPINDAQRPLSPTGAGRNFAAVLKEIERREGTCGGREEQQGGGESGGQKSGGTSRASAQEAGESDSAQSRTERAPEAVAERSERRGRESGDEHRDDDGRQAAQHFQFGAAGSVKSVNTAPVEAGGQNKMLLQVAELERIVSAIRTQIFAGGRREVTIELHRSALEGLRVKIIADREGRLSAEFYAASERVRSELETGKEQLTNSLRERGIELSSLVTQVDNHAGERESGRDNESDENNREEAR